MPPPALLREEGPLFYRVVKLPLEPSLALSHLGFLSTAKNGGTSSNRVVEPLLPPVLPTGCLHACSFQLFKEWRRACLLV
jgi:hypothetical protein